MQIPICLDDKEHKQAFEATRLYIKEKYNLIIDESCKDVRRLCFFSYDPQLVLNQDVVPMNTRNGPLQNLQNSLWRTCRPYRVHRRLIWTPPTDLITVSAEHYLEQGLQQLNLLQKAAVQSLLQGSTVVVVLSLVIVGEGHSELLINAAEKRN